MSDRRIRWAAGIALGAALLAAWLWRHDRAATASPPATGRHEEPTHASATDAVPARRASTLASTADRVSAVPANADDASPDDPRIERCHGDYLAAIPARTAALEASAEPRDRLGAALLRQTFAGVLPGLGDSATAGFAAAVERDPDDALAAWLYAAHCGAGCDQYGAIGHWLKLEPDNAAAWLAALDAAMRRDDLRSAETLLRKAAAAPRIDLRWGEVAQLARRAIGTPAMTPACKQAAKALGARIGLDRPATPADMAILTANAMPPLPTLRGFLELCPLQKAIPADRLPACQSVFRLMARNDLLLLHLVGLQGLSIHAGATERASWVRQWHDAQWMRQQAPLFFKPEHVPLAWEQGEVAVMIALLQEAGRWPAPQDWQPPLRP
jgi:hypothetical protein